MRQASAMELSISSPTDRKPAATRFLANRQSLRSAWRPENFRESVALRGRAGGCRALFGKLFRPVGIKQSGASLLCQILVSKHKTEIDLRPLDCQRGIFAHRALLGRSHHLGERDPFLGGHGRGTGHWCQVGCDRRRRRRRGERRGGVRCGLCRGGRRRQWFDRHRRWRRLRDHGRRLLPC